MLVEGERSSPGHGIKKFANFIRLIKSSVGAEIIIEKI